MTNELVPMKDYSALDAAIGTDLDDEPLRFKEGEYLRGYDKIEVALGTRLRVHPESYSDGFVKWDDNRPVDWRIRECANPTQLPIFRDTLDALDKIGKDDDPWTKTWLIAMKDPAGEILRFTTSTDGGDKALRKLMSNWRRERDKHWPKVPVVELGVTSYFNAKYHRDVPKPVLTIVDWADWENGKKTAPQITPTQDDPRTMIGEELNDDLPAWADS